MFHYLVSYHYYGRTDLNELADAAGVPDLTFFADSGAFSAHASGAEVTLEDYAAWVERWRHRLHAYASFDVMGDWKQSAENLERMREMGLDPVPVFHVGSPLEAYDRILETSSYVAIGGMVKASITMRDKRLWRYLGELHERAERAGTRLHGFGLSSWPVIRRFPWYSVDSSAAGSGYRYGRLLLYNPYADRWHAWHLSDRKAWSRWGWLVREYGMKPADFQVPAPANRGALIAISARSWSRAAETLNDTRVHVVDTSTGDRGGEGKRQWMRHWEDGNTRVYITDGAFTAKEPTMEGSPARIGAFERENSGTRIYVTDPHPSPSKNYERIGVWQDGNHWPEGVSA